MYRKGKRSLTPELGHEAIHAGGNHACRCFARSIDGSTGGLVGISDDGYSLLVTGYLQVRQNWKIGARARLQQT